MGKGELSTYMIVELKVEHLRNLRLISIFKDSGVNSEFSKLHDKTFCLESSNILNMKNVVFRVLARM